MSCYRLNENHPVFQKLEKIFELMENEGIKIYYNQATNKMHVHVEGYDHPFELGDIEHGSYWYGAPMVDLPPSTEYKITYEKENDNA